MGIALGYASLMVVIMTQSIIEEFTEAVFTWQFAYTNAAYLLVPENSRDLVIDDKAVTHFDTAVSSELAARTILVSLIFIAIYMLITYINFKKADRD